jgi:hypothetical protein
LLIFVIDLWCLGLATFDMFITDMST